MMHIPIDMFKYIANSVHFSIVTVQWSAYTLGKSIVPMDVGMYKRLLPVLPVCRRGGKEYKVGQRFPAGDGCNTW